MFVGMIRISRVYEPGMDTFLPSIRFLLVLCHIKYAVEYNIPIVTSTSACLEPLTLNARFETFLPVVAEAVRTDLSSWCLSILSFPSKREIKKLVVGANCGQLKNTNVNENHSSRLIE